MNLAPKITTRIVRITLPDSAVVLSVFVTNIIKKVNKNIKGLYNKSITSTDVTASIFLKNCIN